MGTGVQFLRTLTTGVFDEASGQVAIALTTAGAQPVLTVADYTFGTTYDYLVSATGGLTALATTVQGTEKRIAVSVSGTAGSLSVGTLADVVASAGVGAHGGMLAYLSATPSQDRAVSLLAVSSGAATYVVGAAADYSGLTVWSYGTDGALTTVQTVADSNNRHIAHVSDLASVTVAGATYVFAGSSTEDGVTGFRLGSDGKLSQVSDLGAEDSVPINTVTALDTTVVGDGAYLVVASAVTSSLTVMQVAANGALTVTDHVIDDLNTRFAGAAQLDVIEAGGRSYVIASGADDGMSVFVLTEEGRLVHLSSLSDTVTQALGGISGLAATVSGNALVILATSSRDAGLSSYSLDLGTAGSVAHADSGTLNGTAGNDLLSLRGSGNAAISAGAGDDILTDGLGQDTLTGGSGADTFVMRLDGKTDTIADVQAGVDKIDLSAWTGLRDVTQLAYTATSTGARIVSGNETLVLVSSTGTTLSLAQVRALIDMAGSHVVVTVADRLTSTAPATPVTGTVPVETPVTSGVVTDTLAGGTSAAPIKSAGTLGSDMMPGDTGADTLLGGGGNDTIYGFAGNDSLSGDSGNDFLRGGTGNDLIFGGSGNDSILGEAGRDTITGGSGNDTLTGGTDNDSIDGQDGNDAIWGDAGNDSLTGGSGNDSLHGGSGNDTMNASVGDDWMNGDSGNDWLLGWSGNDRIYGGTGLDTLQGGSGNDTIYGGDDADRMNGDGDQDRLYGDAGNDTLRGDAGNDMLDGGSGNDSLLGGTGNDTLTGGDGADQLYGEDGLDRLFGNAGNDTLSGGAGNDSLDGGTGNDSLTGGDGNDTLRGAENHDTLSGNAGDDSLDGGALADRLDGGAGNDRLIGGTGNDTMTGGDGADVFVFQGWQTGDSDVITDFRQGTDRISLSGVGGTTSAAHFAALDITQSAAGTTVSYNGEHILLQGVQSVAASDFLFT